MKRVEIVSPLLGRPILLLSYTVLSTLLAIIRHPLHSSSYHLSPLLLTSHLLHVIWHPLRSSSYHLSTSAPLVIIHHHLPLLSSLLSTHFAALLWTWKCFILLFFLLLPPSSSLSSSSSSFQYRSIYCVSTPIPVLVHTDLTRN